VAERSLRGVKIDLGGLTLDRSTASAGGARRAR
jgi:hypothetical protein